MGKFVNVKHGEKKVCPQCGWEWDEIDVKECPVCNISILDIMMGFPILRQLLQVGCFLSPQLRYKAISRISSQISIKAG